MSGDTRRVLHVVTLLLSVVETGGQTVSIGFYHPDIDAALNARTAVSSRHPSVHSQLQAALPSNHQNVDTLLAQGRRLPRSHPPVNPFAVRRPPVTFTVSVSSLHVNVTTAFAGGQVLPTTHGIVQTMMATALPTGHPNVDTILRNPTTNPLPSWHPPLDRYVARRAPVDLTVRPNISVGHYHPDADAMFAANTAISAQHPSVQTMLASVLPSSHPNVDTILRNPSTYTMPSWHPPLSQFTLRRQPVVFNVSVSSFHVNVTTAFAAGQVLPATHGSVQTMMAGVLSSSHPNVDTILRNPAANPLPSWHPPLDQFVARRAGVDLTVRPNISVGYYHPDADAMFAAGTAISTQHPSVQTMLTSVLPPTHPNVDTILRNPSTYTMPSWHPPLSQFMLRRQPVTFSVSVSAFHVNVTTSFAAGQALPATHGSVQTMMATGLSSTHPNVDAILRNPTANSLPSWHPPLDQYVARRAAVGLTVRPNVSVGHYHPDADAMFAAGTPISAQHPTVQTMLASVLPPTHPNVDTILRNPTLYTMPSWHPPLSQFMLRRQPVTFSVSVSSFHVNVTSSFAAGQALPATHGSVQSMMAGVLSSSHPNVDTILRNPAANPLPSWHPPLDQFVARRAPVDLTVRPNISVGHYHPDADAMFAAGTAISAQHPTVQTMLASVLPPTHPNVDTILRNPSTYTMPSWHPPLSQFMLRRQPVVFNVSVSSFHVNVTTAFAAGQVLPATHGSVQTMMAGVLSSSHPNVDTILRNPAANPLPSWHPPLDQFVARRAAVDLTVRPNISIGYYHPDADAMFAAGTAISVRHPSVQSMLTSVLPPTHPNVDTILRNPSTYTMPSWHPPLSQFVVHRQPVAFNVSVSSFHVNVTTSFAAGQALPATHGSVETMMAPALPTGHPNVDTILRNPTTNPLPSWHPPLDQYVARRAPVDLTVRPNVSVGYYHPDADAMFAANTAISIRHPSVQAMLSSVLPSTHPNVDTILRNPSNYTMPSWHPPLSQFLVHRQPVSFNVSVSSFHVNVTTSFAAGQALPATHGSVQTMMASVLPTGHPNVDTILRNPTTNPLPSWHPPLDQYVVRQAGVSLDVRPNISVGYYHPDADAMFAAGTAISAQHPAVHPLLAAVLPSRHPNVDTILRNPSNYTIPSWHPPLAQFMLRRPPIVFNVSVSSFHVNVTTSFAAGYPLPQAHSSVQTMMAPALPAIHPNVDAILRNPAANPLPSWHPPLDQYVAKQAGVGLDVRPNVSVGHYHPDADAMFAAGTAISAQHPSVQTMLASVLPQNHPNVDTILQNPSTYTMPPWHPPLSQFMLHRQPVTFSVSVSSFHVNVTTTFAAGQVLPTTHGSVQTMMAGVLSSSHPNVDTILRNPAANPLPSWHPPLDQFVTRRAGVDLTVRPNVSVGYYHPDADAMFAAGTAISTQHPSVQTLLTSVLPSTHPNVDTILRNPSGFTMPSWHPPLSQFMLRRPPVTINVSVSDFHVNVDTAFAAGRALPTSHSAVQTMMASVLPAIHPNVDTILRDPTANPLPAWHPPLDQYLRRSSNVGASATGFRLPSVSVAIDHPDIDASYSAGQSIPGGHPSVHAMLSDYLPAGHPNVDTFLAAPGAHPLPSWHPRLNDMVERRTFWSPGIIFMLLSLSIVVVWVVARACRRARKRKVRLPAAPPRQPSVAMRSKGPLNENLAKQRHVSMNPMFESMPRPSFDAYSYLDVEEPAKDGTGGKPTRVVRSTPKKSPASSGRQHKSSSSRQTTGASAEAGVLPPSNGFFAKEPARKSVKQLPHRSRSLHKMSTLHQRHGADKPMYEYQSVPPTVPTTTTAVYEKEASLTMSVWRRLVGTRIAGSQWTSGDVIFCFGYILLNLIALLASPGYPIDRGLGSLAAANTIFLVMCATRNSVLTWFLGLPFDKVVLQHRFLGRVTIGLVFLHFCWYFDRFTANPSELVVWTGFTAFAFGLVIVATTMDWIRRHAFNVFFWAHYSFLGFFIFAYIHVRQARPFLLVAIGLYALDKLLRAVWTQFPTRTTLMRPRGDQVAQVQFAKNALTSMMGRFKVGQYMFINFPELSLTEWHPFSVSSGPGEDHIELHIRALGDHTREIVALAKQCAIENRQTWIRSDGPYGYLGFNYRRYGVLFLVGGGIGVTPVVSLLKDIYGNPLSRSRKPHAMKKVYAVWIMPHANEADLFMDTFEEHLRVAEENPSLPDLEIVVHCTRATAKEVKSRRIKTGRPDFPTLLDKAAKKDPSASTLVFACGPGRMVNQLWDETTARNSVSARYDFHHETFEF